VGIGACTATVLYEPAFTVIAQWFIQKRSTALATVTFAAGLASTIFLPLSDALLRAYGWRTAVLILGVFLALTTIPLHALMLRRHPDALGLLPDGATQQAAETKLSRPSVTLRGALHDRIFWLVALGFCLASLSAAAIRVHFIPFLIGAGVSSSSAAFTAGLIGVMQVTGRLIFAPLDRRWSGRLILIGLFLLQSIAMMILLIGQAPFMLGLFILIFGASQGAVTLARPAILAGLYGSSHYGRISSILAVLLTITGTAAPLGASLLVDHFGSYQPVLWIVFGLAVAATTVAFIARPHGTYLTAHPMQPELIEGVADGAAD
jgi:predicted MFS family arabinose efflux permease